VKYIMPHGSALPRNNNLKWHSVYRGPNLSRKVIPAIYTTTKVKGGSSVVPEADDRK
jgi:hypothetical protein